MPDPRPLLTVAVPTFNRCHYLRDLLEALQPQLRTHADVELLVSDNASTDGTQALLEQFQSRIGARLRVHRQPENLGSDENFVFCFEQARGRYVWICGDDDILVPATEVEPGALDQLLPHLRTSDFDLIYATSFPFSHDWRREATGDPLARQWHVIRSAGQFMRIVNIMFTFISGIIVNKDRFLALQRSYPAIESPRHFLGSNLPQLSWTLPLLAHHRRSLVLWRRPVGGRQGNANGYSISHVFGRQLVAIAARTLPDRPDLIRILLNSTLRRWFPSVVYSLRGRGSTSATLLEGASILRQVYGSNPRYWLFTWPVLHLPLPLAKLCLRLGGLLSKLLYLVQVRGFWKKVIADKAGPPTT